MNRHQNKYFTKKNNALKNSRSTINQQDFLCFNYANFTPSKNAIFLESFLQKNLHKKLSLSVLLGASIFAHALYANALDQEINNNLNQQSKKIPSQIKTPNENIINTKEIQVREQNGMLQSNELEIIDLYAKAPVDEKLDYSHCAEYYKKASIKLGDELYAIKLKNGAIIGYSQTRPQIKNLAKYDPFTGLFMLQGKANSQYSYELSHIDEYALTRELASTGINGAKPGKFIDYQNGFLQYAQFSVPTQKNGVISNICYKIYGLGVGKNQFIEKSYIDRFLSQEKPSYGDIGVRFEVLDMLNATFVVQFADPFFPNNPFKRGDILISINDIAPKNWAALELLVANLPINKIVEVKIKRGNEIMNMEVKVGPKYGGLLLADSFLERFKFKLSKDMIVEKVPAHGPFSKLKKGDKILFINHIDMRKFKPRNSMERQQLFREIFTRIQGEQIDFLAQKASKAAKEKNTKRKDLDILAQFQSKGDEQDRTNSFYQTLSENMENFIDDGEMSLKDYVATLENGVNESDFSSFSGDGILRDSGTHSMHTIYDLQETNAKKSKKDRIKEYDALSEYNGQITFLIDRQGFQFRVPLE